VRGSIARQIAKLANRNIPYHRHHAQFMSRGWLEGRKLFLFSVGLHPVLSRSLNFSRSLVFFGSIVKFRRSASSRFRDHWSETGCK